MEFSFTYQTNSDINSSNRIHDIDPIPVYDLNKWLI